MPNDEEVEERLVQRDNDTEEIVTDRLEIYYEDIKPVIEHHRKQGDLIEVDGEAHLATLLSGSLKPSRPRPNRCFVLTDSVVRQRNKRFPEPATTHGSLWPSQSTARRGPSSGRS